jgi:dTDP-4-amino-4,6-dideoxygalactose transaminase
MNSRLDEIQAAMLRVKLNHLDAITDHKRHLAGLYFENLPKWITMPRQKADEYDVFHIFGVRHQQRDLLRQHLLDKGIKTEVHYPIPPHEQTAMSGILSGKFPLAEELHRTELSLPISMGHDDEDIRSVCSAIADFHV